MANVKITRALLSVSDKSGLAALGAALARHGVELVSTGGTAKALREAGLPVQDVSRPHRLPRDDGRPGQDAAPQGAWRAARRPRRRRARAGAWSITASRPSIWSSSTSTRSRRLSPRARRCDEIIENIDIGGPSMVRAAAKNHAYVAIAADPADYAPIIAELRRQRGATTTETRRCWPPRRSRRRPPTTR